MRNAWVKFKSSRVIRIIRAIWGIKAEIVPRWMIPLLVACVFIIGPFDEILIVLVIGVRVLTNRRLRRLVLDTIRAACKIES